MNSLWARLLTATGIVLLIFTVLVGFALENAVRGRVVQAQHDRMQGLSYALLGNAEIGSQGQVKIPPGVLPEARFAQPGSGLYALVVDDDGKMLWRSPSVDGEINLKKLPEVGQWEFSHGEDEEGNDLIVLSFGFRWIMPGGKGYRYTLVVAENSNVLVKRMQRFRGALWTVLFTASFLLLIAVVLVLRWGLAPLRRLTRSLRRLQNDEDRKIAGHYPEEIEPLVENLNAMLSNDAARLKRYRNALGDLAHSFKTPLAVLNGVVNEVELSDHQQDQLKRQLARMNDILDYQLQKAATAGRPSLSKSIALAPIIDKLVRTLVKVYAEKGVHFDNQVASGLSARIESGDFMELMGVLMDNAAKYGAGEVTVWAAEQNEHLRIYVDDNGPGFPGQKARRLLERGTRADTTREGQGLGLSMAAEIIWSYNGYIDLGQNEDQGGRVVISLPLS